MKKIKLKLAAALFVCAVFVCPSQSFAQTDGDMNNGNFCLQNPTAVICQPPPPCTGAECPEDGGSSRSTVPSNDDEGDSFWNWLLNPFGL